MKTNSIRIKVATLTLATITAFGSLVPTAQAAEMNQPEVTKEQSLEGYLTSIAPKDKSTLLVNYGTGTNIDLKSSIADGDGMDFLIIRREKDTVYGGGEKITTVGPDLNGIYPGALVHADSKLVNGCPDTISGSDLPRKPVTVAIDINGNTLEPTTVENPDYHNVMEAINKQVQDWQKEGHTTAADLSCKSAMVYDEKQLETQLGVKDAADKFGVDIRANLEGKMKEMLVVFDQVYFTARVDQKTASGIFEDSVTAENLADHGVNEKNPGVAQVTDMDFGRQIVVKFSTCNTSDEIEEAWEDSVGSACIDNKNKYKSVMENTTFNVYACGGPTGADVMHITSTHNLSEVNEIIKSYTFFTGDSESCVISYGTNFIDDGSRASITRKTEYVKPTIEKRGLIRVNTNSANFYSTKHQKFYARPIIGVNDNGSLRLGNWQLLIDEEGANRSMLISGKYAEFGFGFDIDWGTNWPYSDVFWRAAQGPVNNINIEWGGICRAAWIKIKVNDREVVNNSNCSSHSPYNFGC